MKNILAIIALSCLSVIAIACAAHAEGLSASANAIATAVPVATVGTSIASASTIAPTHLIQHVSGTAAIANITLPSGMTAATGGCIILIADGAWTTTTAGNIYATSTAVAGTPYQFCYEGSKWYGK